MFLHLCYSEFILGLPRYDIEICTSYVMDKLIENGFR